MADYETYIDWKDWKGEKFLTYTSEEQYQFRKEFGRYLKDKKRVLEIGFGNGTILGILRDEGKNVSGVEINHALIERAKEAGIPAYGHINEIKNEKFDCVLAFDVLEHIPADELPTFFNTISGLLVDDGIFIARFPNGDSPFALPTQHGDVTHVTSVGWNKVTQLAKTSKLHLLDYKGEIQYSRLLSMRLLRSIISSIRNLFADLILHLFYPRMPKGQATFRYVNIIAILGKLPQ